jgi:hypothetical protein
MEELTLDDLANKYETDKGTLYGARTVHGYAPLYDTYLNKWRHEDIRMLELGICMEGTPGGHSVRMWYNYFTQANIFTFDIVDMTHLELESDRVKFYQGDQGNREDFKKMYKNFGNKPFDFILEDGSHLHYHQMISLGGLFPYVKSGGYYILEDMTERGIPTCCSDNDDTLDTLRKFIDTGVMDNEHLTDDEKIYLQNNISKIEIFPDILNAYRVAIIHKK